MKDTRGIIHGDKGGATTMAVEIGDSREENFLNKFTKKYQKFHIFNFKKDIGL